MIETLLDLLKGALERLDALEYLAAEQKVRQSNIVRTGVAQSFDPATNSVVMNLGDDAASFLTNSIPVFTHGGAGADWRPIKAGQQMTLLCADGDLSNAVAIPGGFHDANPAPSSSAAEDLVCARGTVRLRTSAGAASVEADSKSALRVQPGGWVTAAVQGTTQFVIYDGSQYWMINPMALLPAAPPPKAS